MDTSRNDPTYTVLLAIWAGLTGGVAVLAGVMWGLASGVLGGGEPLAGTLPAPVWIAALALAVLLMGAGIVLRRGAADVGDTEAPLVTFQRRSIVAWAVQEGGGFLGVVTSMLAGRPGWILVAAGLGVFSMLLTRPARDELARLGRR